MEQGEEWLYRGHGADERNMTAIPTIALEADRYGVSNRAAAAISSAALVDYGLISPEERINIIDHSKVWRARQNLRESLKKNRTEDDTEIIAFFLMAEKI